FDATLTLFRRYRNKEKLTQAHRKHAYQRAVQSGYSHSKVTLAALIINIVLGLLAYIAYEYCYALLPGLIISIILLYAIVKFIDKRKAFEYEKRSDII
ncbi:MAG: hypothetical protein K8R74_11700, partial [Bacteroidales bacterium]|nr:hypothetical protein [Bacteroidales bacterium]